MKDGYIYPTRSHCLPRKDELYLTSFGLQSGTKLLHSAHLNPPKVIDRRKAFTGTFNRTEGS